MGCMAAGLLLLGVLAYYNWIVALVGLLILARFILFNIKSGRKKISVRQKNILQLYPTVKESGGRSFIGNANWDYAH